MKFQENRGNFELKLSFEAEIKSLIGTKVYILDFKTLSSPSLVSLVPSQTDGTKTG